MLETQACKDTLYLLKDPNIDIIFLMLDVQANLLQDTVKCLILLMHLLEILLKEYLGCGRTDGEYHSICQVINCLHKAKLWLQHGLHSYIRKYAIKHEVFNRCDQDVNYTPLAEDDGEQLHTNQYDYSIEYGGALDDNDMGYLVIKVFDL